jgi:hypothetical protein
VRVLKLGFAQGRLERWREQRWDRLSSRSG